jgi:hypothetical protein
MTEVRSAQLRVHVIGRHPVFFISAIQRDPKLNPMFQLFHAGCLRPRILDFHYGLIVISDVSRVTPRSAA